MSLASWFSLPKFNLSSALKLSRPEPRPTRYRLSLEMLEDRMLLSTAGSANQMGGANNPTLVNFSLPTTSFLVTQNPIDRTGIANGTSFSNSVLNANQPLSFTALADQLVQGAQATTQFRALGVNSQGQGNPLLQNQFFQLAFFTTAAGFGSGTWPNRPWVPAAYNLGLANHQFGYPSQADLGFQTAPPWANSVNQLSVRNTPLDEEGTWIPEHLLIDHSTEEPEQGVKDQSYKPFSENEKALPEKPELQEQGEPSLKRGDPSTEEALFMPYGKTVNDPIRANRSLPNNRYFLSDAQTIQSEEQVQPSPAEEKMGIPTTLWLSALAPAQLTAMVAGLPAVPASAEPAASAPTAGAE